MFADLCNHRNASPVALGIQLGLFQPDKSYLGLFLQVFQVP